MISLQRNTGYREGHRCYEGVSLQGGTGAGFPQVTQVEKTEQGFLGGQWNGQFGAKAVNAMFTEAAVWQWRKITPKIIVAQLPLSLYVGLLADISGIATSQEYNNLRC